MTSPLSASAPPSLWSGPRPAAPRDLLGKCSDIVLDLVGSQSVRDLRGLLHPSGTLVLSRGSGGMARGRRAGCDRGDEDRTSPEMRFVLVRPVGAALIKPATARV
jgi:hypothetical protein